MESSWWIRPNMQMPSTPNRLCPFSRAMRSLIIPAALGCQSSGNGCEEPAQSETFTQTQWACVSSNVFLRRLVAWRGGGPRSISAGGLRPMQDCCRVSRRTPADKLSVSSTGWLGWSLPPRAPTSPMFQCAERPPVGRGPRARTPSAGRARTPSGTGARTPTVARARTPCRARIFGRGPPAQVKRGPPVELERGPPP